MSTKPFDATSYEVPAPSRAGIVLSTSGRILASYLTLIAVGAVMVVPFIAMISVSLQVGSRSAVFPIDWIPDSPTLENYRNLFEHTKILRWFANSLLVASVGRDRPVTSSTAANAFAPCSS